MSAVLRLKRGHDRARVHPWIFKGDVADVGAGEPGDAVTIVDSTHRFVGRGFFNPRPALCCRVLTREDEPLDAAFFGRRVGTAIALRGTGTTLARLVWSEADGLPGLVVDRYDDVLVIQCLTLAGGARLAVCIESSADALAMARENLALNAASDRATLVAANVFDELRRLERERARFDLVVLDPPPFARSRAALDAAARGYKE